MTHIATTFREIWNGTDKATKNRANRSRIYKVSGKSNDVKRFNFLVRSSENYSSSVGWIFSVHYPDLPELSEFKNDHRVTPMKQDARMWCTCPAWTFTGPSFNSTEGDYNQDGSENRSPNIRDPKREHLVCKHGIRVARYLSKMGFESLYDRFSRVSSDLPEAPEHEVYASAAHYLKRKGYADDEIEDLLFGSVFDVEENLDFESRLIKLGVITP